MRINPYVFVGTIGLVIAASGYGMLSWLDYNREREPRQLNLSLEREFICSDDDKLTERHVYVASAWPQGLVWNIQYMDGRTSRYVQATGETCEVLDIAVPPATVKRGCDAGECVNSGAGYE